jgi:hypothetical protein
MTDIKKLKGNNFLKKRKRDEGKMKREMVSKKKRRSFVSRFFSFLYNFIKAEEEEEEEEFIRVVDTNEYMDTNETIISDNENLFSIYDSGVRVNSHIFGYSKSKTLNRASKLIESGGQPWMISMILKDENNSASLNKTILCQTANNTTNSGHLRIFTQRWAHVEAEYGLKTQVISIFVGDLNSSVRLSYDTQVKNDEKIGLCFIYNGGDLNKEAEIENNFKVFSINLDTLEKKKLSVLESNIKKNGYSGDIQGSLYISQYLSTDPQAFSGYISSLVVSTLTHEKVKEKYSDELNTDEIALVTTDPLNWIRKYKIDAEYRQNSGIQNTEYFGEDELLSSHSTQVWLFGDGEHDLYPNIKNQIYSENDNDETDLFFKK